VSAPALVRGSAFGFDIHSPFPFETLRPAAGLPPLRVVGSETAGEGPPGELVAEIEEPGFHARIFRDGADFALWVDRVGWFRVDPATAHVEAPLDADPFEREELVLGVPALLCFLQRGETSLHAAAIDVDGAAVVLAAPHGSGKSTLAAAFVERGFRMLSEDLTCIRLGREPAVLPGPASIRLRNDVAAELGPRLECIRAGRERSRYITNGESTPVPIRAVIILHRSARDIYLEDVTPLRALPDLWQATFRLTRAHERAAFAGIAALADTTAVQRLHRPVRFDALEATIDAIVSRTAA
jgi:hypothetical protein